jgi:hypothetical protein
MSGWSHLIAFFRRPRCILPAGSGAYTFAGARDLIHDRAGQLGLGADVTIYSKPAVLDLAYGDYPVPFQIFLRMRPGESRHGHHGHRHRGYR